MNIQEAVNRVAHTGQAEVALHGWGCHGGPAERIVVEFCGMVLVLAADMVRGVLHTSRVRCARPQWTIQVYTPRRAWPFSTWAVLAVMWHLAPDDAPTGTTEQIARNLHTWPTDRDFPWGRPRGGLPVGSAAERFSVAATLRRHLEKRACHFLQTGTVPAAPPDPESQWDAGGAQLLPDPWVLPLWYPPMGTLAHAAQAVKGAFPQPLIPGVTLLRSLQAGAAWVRWMEADGRPSRYFPGVQGQALHHAEGMGTVYGGAIVPDAACRWITVTAPQPMRSPPACHHLLQAVPSLAPHHAFTRGRCSGSSRPPPPGSATSCTGHQPLRNSSPTRCWTCHWSRYGCSTRRPTSHRLGRLGLQRRVEAAHPGGVVEQWLTLHNPSTTQGPLVPVPTPLPAPDDLGAPPTEPVPHAPGAPGRAELPAAGPACPPYGHNSTAEGKQKRQRGRTGLHKRQSGGLDGSLQAPCPGYHRAQAIPRPSPWDSWQPGQRNCRPTSPAETRGPASQLQRTR